MITETWHLFLLLAGYFLMVILLAGWLAVRESRKNTVTPLAAFFENLKRCELHMIGNTPIIGLPAPGHQNRIFAKLEYQNLTGSHYDRVYRRLLLDLEGQGKIVPGKTVIVETTSGNAGISCAALARIAGYQCLIFCPGGLPVSRIGEIRRRGATVSVTPRESYIQGAAEKMREFLVAHKPKRINGQRRFFTPNHSQVESSCDALEAIATEALAQARVPHFDCFVGAAGNGSTLKGIGRALKRANAAMRIIAWDPAEALVAYQLKYGCVPGHTPMLHRVYGAGAWGVHFPHLQEAVARLVDEVRIVTESEWQSALVDLQRYGREIGQDLTVSATSAASYKIACDYCRENSGKNVLILFYEHQRERGPRINWWSGPGLAYRRLMDHRIHHGP